MPELPEVEAYRLLAASRALHRPIASVDAPDSWILKRGLVPQAIATALPGLSFVEARRRGKLLLLDTDGGPTLGVRFGMTGRLVVDGVAGVDQLLYSTTRYREGYDRFSVRFADGGAVRLHDPRRLGGVELDPDENRLGPDARTLTVGELRDALAGRDAPLKAVLMDQARIAGIGNLMADEMLWRAALAPGRAAGSVAGSAADLRRLHRHLRATVEDLIARGGSHTGDLMPARRPGGLCPRDGTPLNRSVVGGRTSWWCAHHQR